MNNKINILLILSFCFISSFSQDTIQFYRYYTFKNKRISQVKKSFLQQEDNKYRKQLTDESTYTHLVKIGDEIYNETKDSTRFLFLKFNTDTTYRSYSQNPYKYDEVGYSFHKLEQLVLNDSIVNCLQFRWEFKGTRNFDKIQSYFLDSKSLQVVKSKTEYYSNNILLFERIYSIDSLNSVRKHNSHKMRKNIKKVLEYNFNVPDNCSKKSSKKILSYFGYLDFVYLVEHFSSLSVYSRGQGHESTNLKMFISSLPSSPVP